MPNYLSLCQLNAFKFSSLKGFHSKFYSNRLFRCWVIFMAMIVWNESNGFSQEKGKTDTISIFNLEGCLAYALQHQPAVIQSAIGIDIAHRTNLINLSSWMPQIGANGTFNHYYVLPTAIVAGIKEKSGLYNTFLPQLTVTETLFNPAVLNSAVNAHLLVEQAKQSNDSTKIDLIANVSKSFYNLLLSLEQVTVLKEDTARLAKNMRDTYHQYVGGTVDKTDYKQAVISLNNSKAQLKQTTENILPQFALLKLLMGFPQEREFNIQFDTTKMLQEIAFDTTQQLQCEKRIEFQLLQTGKQLQEQNINFYRTQFLPSLSAFYDYTYEYENNSMGSLFNQSYPYSIIGATITIPIFTGLQRVANIQKAKLQLQQLEYSEYNLKSAIVSQYKTAMAEYKSNLYDLAVLKENVAMSKDVYAVVSLQYKQGIVPYLNVITAESDLISSEINYTTALFQLLSSKVDLEKAMGLIQVKL